MLGKTKIIQIGNSVGIVLPKEVLAALHAEKGDTLTLNTTPDGVRISAYDPEVQKQVDAGREVMRDYRDTLRALAK
jgi:putative addiction module antidote